MWFPCGEPFSGAKAGLRALADESFKRFVRVLRFLAHSHGPKQALIDGPWTSVGPKKPLADNIGFHVKEKVIDSWT